MRERGALSCTIFCWAAPSPLEIFATTQLKLSEGFTKLGPSVLSLLGYGVCFFPLLQGVEPPGPGHRLRHLERGGHCGHLGDRDPGLWAEAHHGGDGGHGPDCGRGSCGEPLWLCRALRDGACGF